MRVLAASVNKEARLLLRDREGLAILFLMPLVFVVIMSLALQDFFRPDSSTRFDLVLLDPAVSTQQPVDVRLGHRIAAALQGVPGLRVNHVKLEPEAKSGTLDATPFIDAVRRGTLQFVLRIPADADDRLSAALRDRDPRRRFVRGAEAPVREAGQTESDGRVELELITDPALRADQRALVRSTLERLLLAVEVEETVRALSGPGASASPLVAPAMHGILSMREAAGRESATPTSTQQNVPAYSLLAIFMLVVPLSTTFIREREQGTLLRLRSIRVPAAALIAGKLVPYFVVNLMQMALCLAIGRWLIPALGGEALSLTGAMLGPIALLSGAASLAAIGFALLIAMFARTPEQATAFGAAAVLLMAAIGGIMVPKLLMPEALQRAALGSPMGWALDGFLAVFLRDASMDDVLLPAGALILFALICSGLALRRFGAMMRGA